MNHAVIDHFITRFVETLPLGLLKRKSVPITKAGINQTLKIAVTKVIVPLSLDSLNEVVASYCSFIVETS